MTSTATIEVVPSSRADTSPAVRRPSPAARASLLVGGFAFLVSAIGSWVPSYWGDEAATVLSATRPVRSLLAMLTHVDAVHGLYYLVMHGWIDVAGSSPFATRLPSAVAIGVAAGGVVILCRRLGLAFAVTAGVLTAVMPRLTVVGEEARSYAVTAALAVLVWAVVVEMSHRVEHGRGWWVAYAGLLALGTAFFVYFVLLVPAVAVVVAATPTLRRRWRVWLWATGAAVAVTSPLLLLALAQREQIAFLAHRNRITPTSLLVDMWFAQPWLAVPAWLLIVVGVAGAVVESRRRAGSGASVALVAVVWLVTPAGILLAASTVTAAFTPRYATLSTPAAAILIALGIRTVARSVRTPRRSRMLAAGLVVVMIALAAPAWAHQRTPYAKDDSDWNDVAATIDRVAEPGDAIVFSEANRPSRRTRLAMSTDPAAFAGVTDVTLEVPYADSATWHDTAYTVAEAAGLGRFDGVDRVWVVEYSGDGMTSTWGLADLAALGYHEADRIELHRSVILLYER